jgi:hypothetical protein
MERKRKKNPRAKSGKTSVSAGPTIETSAGPIAGPDADASAGETAPRVGVVAVEVDRAAILNEAAAVAAEAPPETPVPAQAGEAPSLSHEPAPAPVLDPSAKAAEVQPAVRFLVAQVFTVAAPAWAVTDEESNNVADATALVLAYWMPADAIDPKYVALMSLAGALWGVASKRRDEHGNWKPLREKPKPATPAAPVAVPSNALRV